MSALGPSGEASNRSRSPERRTTVNKDEMQGKWEKTKGYVKDKVGEATGDTDLEIEGEAQREAGKVQEKVGEARRKVGETVKDVGDKIKG
jgi:uncharacterized protein YjbJ (UPF0337 family)